jgi:hypothetical protein
MRTRLGTFPSHAGPPRSQRHPHVVAARLSNGERAELTALARKLDLPPSTLAAELIVQGLERATAPPPAVHPSTLEPRNPTMSLSEIDHSILLAMSISDNAIALPDGRQSTVHEREVKARLAALGEAGLVAFTGRAQMMVLRYRLTDKGLAALDGAAVEVRESRVDVEPEVAAKAQQQRAVRDYEENRPLRDVQLRNYERQRDDYETRMRAKMER